MRPHRLPILLLHLCCHVIVVLGMPTTQDPSSPPLRDAGGVEAGGGGGGGARNDLVFGGNQHGTWSNGEWQVRPGLRSKADLRMSRAEYGKRWEEHHAQMRKLDYDEAEEYFRCLYRAMMFGEKAAANDPLKLELRYICLEAARAVKAQRESSAGLLQQESTSGEEQQQGEDGVNKSRSGGGERGAGGGGNSKTPMSSFLTTLSNKINVSGIGASLNRLAGERTKSWIPGVMGTPMPGFALP
ncbi:MAG: hypothetical protein M1816_007755 [Peltula sp. TS41687]|nr:MAG: hypothetical protein M1816_007755 [Peltula sp. TS41687]